jgi:hypothetical protein
MPIVDAAVIVIVRWLSVMSAPGPAEYEENEVGLKRS